MWFALAEPMSGEPWVSQCGSLRRSPYRVDPPFRAFVVRYGSSFKIPERRNSLRCFASALHTPRLPCGGTCGTFVHITYLAA